MIRVLLVAGSVPPSPCGVGDYTFKLAQSLAALGDVEVAILTGNSGSVTEGRQSVLVFPLVASWRLDQAGRVARFLKQWKPDIVHVQYPTQGYGRGFLPSLVPLLARVSGARTVQTWHEGFRRRDIVKLLLQLCAGSKQIVVRSNFIELVHPILRWAVRWSKPMLIANASAIPRTRCGEEEVASAKRSLLQGQRRLLVFFGFLYPPKGVELLFEVANSETDHIVIAGPADEGSPYLEKLKLLANGASWEGKVTFTGFVDPERAALILAAADAVILPFRQGGGPWNTSIHSATLNDAFVITTTSTSPTGYDDKTNVYYARPDDVSNMRSALALYCGRRTNAATRELENRNDWGPIARRHYQIYANLYANKA
jgi:glycosyltransferase involved in cell wall biosynthesis